MPRRGEHVPLGRAVLLCSAAGCCPGPLVAQVGPHCAAPTSFSRRPLALTDSRPRVWIKGHGSVCPVAAGGREQHLSESGGFSQHTPALWPWQACGLPDPCPSSVSQQPGQGCVTRLTRSAPGRLVPAPPFLSVRAPLGPALAQRSPSLAPALCSVFTVLGSHLPGAASRSSDEALSQTHLPRSPTLHFCENAPPPATVRAACVLTWESPGSPLERKLGRAGLFA